MRSLSDLILLGRREALPADQPATSVTLPGRQQRPRGEAFVTGDGRQVPGTPRDKAPVSAPNRETLPHLQPSPTRVTGHLLTLEIVGWPLAKLGCRIREDNKAGRRCLSPVFPVLSCVWPQGSWGWPWGE